MSPPDPTATSTRLATTTPVVTFRFDAVGRELPVGYTVRNPGAAGLTAVTFTTTAIAPAGTPNVFPSTDSDKEVPAAMVLPKHCAASPDNLDGFPGLVSQTRTGLNDEYGPPEEVAAAETVAGPIDETVTVKPADTNSNTATSRPSFSFPILRPSAHAGPTGSLESLSILEPKTSR
jgi:hypothetical protein